MEDLLKIIVHIFVTGGLKARTYSTFLVVSDLSFPWNDFEEFCLLVCDFLYVV
jgi:hypothetical protein